MNTQTVETGLSDFRKLTLTVLKIHCDTPSPKIVTYREYKNVSNESFCSDVLNEMGSYYDFTFTDFNYIFLAASSVKQACTN